MLLILKVTHGVLIVKMFSYNVFFTKTFGVLLEILKPKEPTVTGHCIINLGEVWELCQYKNKAQ